MSLLPEDAAGLRRAPRLVDEVVSELRDRITEGALPAGTPLPQVALAERLGVSRTPLREALRVLEREGLLRTSDARGTVEVVSIGSADLVEMYQVREVIDGLAARLAARRGITAQHKQDAGLLLAEMAGPTAHDDPEYRNRAHADFHELIAVMSGNARILTFGPLIRASSAALSMPLDRMLAARFPAAATPERSQQEIDAGSHRQHCAIFSAIVEGDAAEAEATARNHIRRTLRWARWFGDDRAQRAAGDPATPA